MISEIALNGPLQAGACLFKMIEDGGICLIGLQLLLGHFVVVSARFSKNSDMPCRVGRPSCINYDSLPLQHEPTSLCRLASCINLRRHAQRSQLPEL